MRRLRLADWIVAIAAILLAVLMFAPWFGLSGAGPHVARSGWHAVGWAGDAVIGLAIVGGLAVWIEIASGRAPSVQIVTSVAVTIGAILGTIVAAITVLGPPDLGAAAPSRDVLVRFHGWASLGVLAVLAVACWRSMGDERTTSRASAYAPPAPRPAPPA
jgi:hypothetical protein